MANNSTHHLPPHQSGRSWKTIVAFIAVLAVLVLVGWLALGDAIGIT